MRHLRGELPAWWYTVWPSVQTVGLYKTAEQTTIRPLGIRNPLLKAFHREVINCSREEFLSFLEPQQLGMSLGGASKLIHSIRMLLEANPTFVCATNDCRNAFNENARAAAVMALQQEPSLASRPRVANAASASQWDLARPKFSKESLSLAVNNLCTPRQKH